MVGKPVVKGTRIPVEMVLGQLAYRPDLAELFARFPDLTVDDVRDCSAYAQAAPLGMAAGSWWGGERGEAEERGVTAP